MRKRQGERERERQSDDEREERDRQTKPGSDPEFPFQVKWKIRKIK